jgi:hypothetical protein
VVAIVDVPDLLRRIQSGTFNLSVNSLTFFDALLLSCFIQVGAITFLLRSKRGPKQLFIFIVLEVTVNCLVYLPATGVGHARLAEINAVYRSFPAGIPIPPLQPIDEIDTFDLKGMYLFGSTSFYKKKIGSKSVTTYPSMFASTQEYFESDLPKNINRKPFVFFKSEIDSAKGNSRSQIIVENFSPTSIQLKVNCPIADSLILLQNFYPKWRAKVDGQPKDIHRSFVTFMALPLTKGKHGIVFAYEDPTLIFLALVSMIFFIALVVYLFFSRYNTSRP